MTHLLFNLKTHYYGTTHFRVFIHATVPLKKKTKVHLNIQTIFIKLVFHKLISKNNDVFTQILGEREGTNIGSNLVSLQTVLLHNFNAKLD